jgi:hypothetical protein
MSLRATEGEIFMSTRLCDLAVKWHTDKTPAICHGYTPYYHELLKDKTVKKVLEIGIGYPTHMHQNKDFKPGASLFMWQEYFPEAEIYALDINPEVLINEGRIKSFCCDQGNEESLRKIAAQLGGNFDLIVDDGSHAPDHQVLSAEVLIPLLLNPDGIYVIEDTCWNVPPRLSYECEVKEFNPKLGDDMLIVIRGNKKKNL